MRQNSLNRKTNETDISVILLIDGKGKSKIKTGIGFLDHMDFVDFYLYLKIHHLHLLIY